MSPFHPPLSAPHTVLCVVVGLIGRLAMGRSRMGATAALVGALGLVASAMLPLAMAGEVDFTEHDNVAQVRH